MRGTRCFCALSTKLTRAWLGMGDFTTENTESTEKMDAGMEQDPFAGRVIRLLIKLDVWRLADGIERFKL